MQELNITTNKQQQIKRSRNTYYYQCYSQLLHINAIHSLVTLLRYLLYNTRYLRNTRNAIFGLPTSYAYHLTTCNL